jgi:hypothetical protein
MEREDNTSLFFVRYAHNARGILCFWIYKIDCGSYINCRNCGVDVAAEGAHSELESSVAVLVILYIPSLLETKRATY